MRLPVILVLVAILAYIIHNHEHYLGFKYQPITKGAILITGASKGIGKAAALYLAEKGFKVYAGIRNKEDGTALVNSRKSTTDIIIPVLLEVTNVGQIERVYNQIVKETTEEYPLVAIVNNAGILRNAPFEFAKLDDLVATIEINLLAPALISQKFIPLLRQSKGRIIFISSLGIEVVPGFHGTYEATKAGVCALSTAIRRELAPFGVFSSCIEPGVVVTDMAKRDLYHNPISELPSNAATLYGEFWSEEMIKHREETSHLKFSHTTNETNDAIYHALTSSRPLAKYLLGTQGFILKYTTLLPEWMHDVFLYFIYWPGPTIWPDNLKKLLH